MNTCKTCIHWTAAVFENYRENEICNPIDQNTYEPMNRGFKVRICRQPQQTFCESPVLRNGFGLTDGSNYMARLATAEDFGCVLHQPVHPGA